MMKSQLKRVPAKRCALTKTERKRRRDRIQFCQLVSVPTYWHMSMADMRVALEAEFQRCYGYRSL